MIIKSMSRKAPTFGRLIDYIDRNSDTQTGTETRVQTFDHSAANAGTEAIMQISCVAANGSFGSGPGTVSS